MQKLVGYKYVVDDEADLNLLWKRLSGKHIIAVAVGEKFKMYENDDVPTITNQYLTKLEVMFVTEIEEI